MSRQPHHRERICEVLESCRAGSGDLFSPEFADVASQVAANPRLEKFYEQIQSADLKISAAFLDVEIPPGLEQRILESLAPALPPAKKSRLISRRRLLAAGGTLAATAAIFLAIFLSLNEPVEYSEQTVLENAKQFFDAEDPAAQGHLLADVSPPGEFSFSKAMLRLPKIRWREITNFMGHSGVAFDLPSQGGARAALYVLDLSVADLSDTPDQNNLFTTGGCCAAVWRENGLVYVLVVQGSQKNYRDYLIRSRGTLA